MTEDQKFSAYWELRVKESLEAQDGCDNIFELKEMSHKARERLDNAIKQAHINYQSELVAISRIHKLSIKANQEEV